MAGIKVTDLPVLAESAPDDVLYIVDTSTNTSKQIEVADISITKIGSTDGSNTADFISEIEGGEGRLKAVFNNADFINPFTVLNSSGGIRIGFFNKGDAALVTPQAAAIADATDATDVITQLNLLLAAMRAYGLIAE
jgi:hypothetical protein